MVVIGGMEGVEAGAAALRVTALAEIMIRGRDMRMTTLMVVAGMGGIHKIMVIVMTGDPGKGTLGEVKVLPIGVEALQGIGTEVL